MNVDEKKAFRRVMLARRDAIPSEKRIEADVLRNMRIRNWEVYKNAELLLFYVSYRSEADTLQLIREALADGRKVAAPKVTGNDMVFYRITSVSQLVEGYKGILEPDTEQAVPITGSAGATEEPDMPVSASADIENNSLPVHILLFVPGCAFDEAGGRMGYGGGFYDRFMERYPDCLRVALAYEEQIVENVPREMHDKPVDIIVTEERIVETTHT